MWIESAEVAIVGGFLCLDRIFLQAMISRPIVIAPIIGALLNDPYTGLIAGAFVELLWIDRLPVGTYIPPNDSIAAILITAGSILAGSELGHLPQSLFAFAVLLFVPFGPVGKQVEVLIIRSNNKLSEKAIEDAKAGNIKGISRRHISGLLKILLSTVILIFVPLVLGSAVLVWLFPLLPEEILKTFYYIYFFFPVLGIAVALSTIKLRGTIPVFSGFFLIFALITEFF